MNQDNIGTNGRKKDNSAECIRKMLDIKYND